MTPGCLENCDTRLFRKIWLQTVYKNVKPDCVKEYDTRLCIRIWHQTVYKNVTPDCVKEYDTRLCKRIWHQTVYKYVTPYCCKPRDGPKGLSYKYHLDHPDNFNCVEEELFPRGYFLLLNFIIYFSYQRCQKSFLYFLFQLFIALSTLELFFSLLLNRSAKLFL